MQSASCEMLGWMKHNLESRLPGEISITSRHADDTTLLAESEEELKSLLMKVNEENEKPGLKFNIQKLRSWHPVPSLHGKQMGKQWKQRQTAFSWAPKSLRTLTATKKLKDTSNFSSPWKKSYDRPRSQIKKQRPCQQKSI